MLIRTAQFLLSMMVLITLHEFGHYLAAMCCRTRVDKFYIFFNPWFSIFKFKIKHTTYGLGWLPVGGFCKIAGMVDESRDTDQLASEPKPWEFRAKPAWQRLLMVSGGVIMNLLVAWVIYSCLLFSNGESYLATEDVTYGIAADSLAQEIGFRSGDRIVMVNGDSIENFLQIYSAAVLTPNSRVTVERNGHWKDVIIESKYLPELMEGEPLFGVRIPFVIAAIAPGSVAEKSGLQPGDSLLRINNTPMSFFDEFRNYVRSHREEEIEIVVSRNGAPWSTNLVVPASGLIGVQAAADYSRFFEIKTKRYTLLEAIPAGATRGYETLASYAKSLKLFFVPEAKAHKSVGGFISIGKIFPDYWDWHTFWSLTAFLSLILALMNFLPIPALDGGHALFILYEMITRRRPSEKFLLRAQTIGILILLGLFLYANLNDVFKLLFN